MRDINAALETEITSLKEAIDLTQRNANDQISGLKYQYEEERKRYTLLSSEFEQIRHSKQSAEDERLRIVNQLQDELEREKQARSTIFMENQDLINEMEGVKGEASRAMSLSQENESLRIEVQRLSEGLQNESETAS